MIHCCLHFMSICQREKKRILFLYHLHLERRTSSADSKHIISRGQRCRKVSDFLYFFSRQTNSRSQTTMLHPLMFRRGWLWWWWRWCSSVVWHLSSPAGDWASAQVRPLPVSTSTAGSVWLRQGAEPSGLDRHRGRQQDGERVHVFF